jgi:hypothetical protein
MTPLEPPINPTREIAQQAFLLSRRAMIRFWVFLVHMPPFSLSLFHDHHAPSKQTVGSLYDK